MAQEAVLDSLENRSLPDVKTPEFTMEHKAGVLVRQRHILSLQINGNRAQRQLEAIIAQINQETEKAMKDLNSYIETLSKELNIDTQKYEFDLDNLTIIPKV